MASSSEQNVKAHLLPPPSYMDATKHSSEMDEDFRLPIRVGNLIPSVPATTDVARTEPSTTTRRHPMIIVTAIIVCGLVTIAIIAAVTIIFLQYRIIITTTTTIATTTTTTKRPSKDVRMRG